MTVLNLKNIDINLLNVEEPHQNDDVYISNIKYEQNEFVIQTPKVKINKNVKDSITIKINDDLFDKLGEFDEYIINNISDNSKTWFSDAFDIEEAQDIYKRSIISPFKNNYSYFMKLNCVDDLIINNKYKEKLEKDSLKKDDEIICLIKCNKLVYYKAHCVPYWEVIQIKLKEPSLNKKQYLFNDNDDDDNNNIDNDTKDNVNIKNIKTIDFNKN